MECFGRFQQRVFLFSFIGCALVLSHHQSTAWGNPHTTILKKNNPVKYDSRDELEGSRGVLNHIRIPHGCNDKTFRAMSVVFPNGQDSIATDKGSGEEVELADHITGTVIGVHAVQDFDVFRKIRVQEGTVNNVGTGQSSGVRAIHFKNGRLQEENVGLIPFDAAFPSFNTSSFVGSMQLNIAIANYCTYSRTMEAEQHEAIDQLEHYLDRVKHKFGNLQDVWQLLREEISALVKGKTGKN